MRLAAMAIALSGLEVVVPFLDGVLPVPQGAFAALAGLTTVAAMVARLVAQGDLD